MTDDLSRIAALEYHAERADDLFRDFIDHLHAAYRSDDPFDWLKAGSTCWRFKAAATAAGHDACLDMNDVTPSTSEMH